MTSDPAHSVEGMSPTSAPVEAAGRNSCTIAVVAIIAAIALAMLFPGDAPLNVDESALLSYAAAANARRALVEQGLTGSVSFCYGPIPAQIYQLLLILTHRIPILVILHAVLFLGTIAASLWSIGNTLRLHRLGFIAFVLSTPWLWFYARDLWDNPFCLPISCVALAAYGRWLSHIDRPADHASKTPLLSAMTWSASAVLLPLIHAVGMPMSLAVMGHAMFARWKAFRRSLPWIALGIVLAGSTSWPYLRIASKQVLQRIELRMAGYSNEPTPGMGRPAAPRAGRWVSASYALLAADGLSADHTYFDPPDDLPVRRWLRPLSWMGSVAHAWLAVGLLAAWRILRARLMADHQSVLQDPATSLLFVAVLSIVLLGIEFFLAHTGQAQQYYSGVFASAALLCWVGLDRLWQCRGTRWILVILPGAAIVGSTLLICTTLHRMGGAPHPYGPTIGNRIALAQQLAARRPDKIYCNNLDLNRWPDLLPLAFWPKAPASDRAPVALIAHRNAFAGDFWLIVVYRNPPPENGFVLIEFPRR